ncbi:MAG: TonB-dependent receptor [Porticoccaceae bacterium]
MKQVTTPLALCLLASAAICHAQPLGQLIDETIVTAVRSESPATHHAGNIAILDNTALASTAHTHIQQALNRVAGVNFHRNSGQEYLPAIRSPVLSGPGACGSVLIMENGVPLRPAGFCNVNELFEANSEQARRIEIIRGPGTSVYGANAVHGIINLIDPAALDQPRTIAIESGPDHYWRGKAQWHSDSFALSANATQDGGYRDDAGFHQQKLSARHQLMLDELSLTTSFTAVNLEQDTAGFITGFNAYRDRSLSRINPNPEAFRDVRALRLSSRAELANGWIITPYARYSSMAFLQHFLPGQPLERNGQRSLGLLSQKTWRPQRDLAVTAGLDLEYADTWLKEDQAGPTQGSAMLVETLPQGKHYDYEVATTLAAPFIHADWTFAGNWTLVLGARYERLSYDYDNHMAAGRGRSDGTPCGFGGCRYSRPADRSDIVDNISTRLGISHQRGQRQLYLNISQGYRPPQTTEFYRLQGDQRVADLSPETIAALELGWRGQTGGLGYDLALFAMRKTDVIFRDTSQFTINGGTTHHLGVEYQLDYALSRQWRAGISGSYARHRYVDDVEAITTPIKNNDIDTAPRHFASAYLIWEVSEKISTEIEWVAMGSYYLDPENQHKYPGHDLLHLRAAWQATPGIKLSARLLNLSDEKYAERADYASFGGYRYFPGEPRSVYVGIEYLFR